MVKTNDFLKQFLGGEDDAIELPVGGGDFVPTGFIGPVSAKVLWNFWAEDELDATAWMDEDEDRVGFVRTKTRNGYQYYFRVDAREEARAAATHLGKEYPPRQVWRFEIPAEEVINFRTDDAAEKWRGTVGGDVQISTPRSKYRHLFQMMALPAAVNALALRVGLLEASGFSLDDLLTNQVWNDDVQAVWIGDTEARAEDAAAFDAALTLAREAEVPDHLSAVTQYVLNARNPDGLSRVCAYCAHAHHTEVKKCENCGAKLQVKSSVLDSACADIDVIHWQHSLLWRRRAALWFGLGEDNPQAYNPIGVDSKYTTTSENLSQMLGIVTRPWVKPVWGRLMMVPNPVTDATYGDEERRNTVWCLTEIFPNEEKAREVAEAELEATGAGSEGDKPSSKGLKPPDNWKGFEKEWREELGKRKKATKKGKLPKTPKLVKLASELDVTKADIETWWPEV